MEGAGDAPAEPSVTLHSSWFGILSAMLGVVVLLVIAVALLIANGITAVAVVMSLVAVGAALVLLFDMPIATRFEPTAIVRLTPLRDRRLGLDRIDRFSRMRRAVRRPGSGAPSTGLVAVRGRRQILLVDRMEGQAEHEALRALLGPDEAERLLSGVLPPPMNRTPTWAWRRKRWHPDADRHR